MKRICYAGLALLLFVSPANAQFFAGNHLHVICQYEGLSLEERQPCQMFIIGAWQMYLTVLALSTSTKSGKHGICGPESSIQGQTVDVVRNYLDSHPENRHLPATGLIILALRDVWPCEQLSDE